MQYEEFMQWVKEYAGLDSDEEAVRTTEAVLSTLGERLYRTEVSELAAQLPRGIREFLGARQSPETTRDDIQQFTLEDFYDRVGARTRVRTTQAIRLTQGVMKVLTLAVSAGEIASIMQGLPKEYEKLFQVEA